jgi:hypothetical protein
VKRALAAVVGVLASVVPAAPASAFTPPELFVRMQTWDTHEAASGWIPLASAPALSYLGGYQIGYRLQDSAEPNEFQRVALTVTGVPDGMPTQPLAVPPYCVGRAGIVGTIVEAGPELQFEGDGTYTVKVSVGAGLDCVSAGESTTASFRVPVQVAPVLVGEPMTFRAVPLPGNPFVGVRAAAPPGGRADVRCTLGATTVPSLEFDHPAVVEDVFTRPGAWTCIARGVADGNDENLDSVLFGTPWSSPLAIDVRSDFRRRVGTVSKPRSKRPRFRFRAEWPGLSKGGRAKVTVFRIRGCKGDDFRLRKLAAYRGTFGAKRVQIRMRRPRANGFYLGRFAFSGTRFVRRSTDPNPIPLLVAGHRFGFADAQNFPHCPR